jgi:hypothetical protein
MNLEDIESVSRLCRHYGPVEVIAAVSAHCNNAVSTDYKDNPDAIIHQYAPVVNASLEKLVNVRNSRILAAVTS